ncbi:ABC transporter ATP-binding protein [Lapidilactobacillus concavus]|nr:ABC transporter ATP-binding protein [Lapidilactobacillus concavus]
MTPSNLESITLLTARNLGKRYGHQIALQNVNLEIQRGQFVALVGMSGGGKSTLLRLIAGLETPTTGELDFNVERPIIRVMFQNDRLLPWLDVMANVTFRRHQADVQTRAAKLLTLVGLSDFASRYPAELSGGQKQRVALARALMAEPQLLLLDEPLGALDALTRRKMQDLILQVCREQNLTTILVTHDVEEAARMSDRIIVMKQQTNLYEAAGFDRRDPATVGIVADRVLREIMDEADQKQTRSTNED